MDTKALRQKILDLAIHGKLVPQDLGDEPASVLLQRIREEKERLVKEGKIKKSKKAAKTSDTAHYENVPFEVPSGWEWTTLNELTELIEDCPHSTAKDEGKGFALIRTPNVGEGHLIFDKVHRVSKETYDKRNARAIPQYKDIIYAREAPAGNAAMVDNKELVCLGQRTVLIRPLVNFIDSMWLTYAINSRYARISLISKATGSTVTHVNMESIRPFVLPLPPLEEQHRIVSEIERWFSLIDIIESGKASLQAAVKQAKSKILDLAIHGKLVPQDPADEPASELLRRINPKAEITSDNAQYGKVPFEVPESWEWTTLGEMCIFLSRGKSPKYKDEDRTYPVFAQKCNLKDGGISLEQARFLDPATVEKWGEEYKLKTGDVLINSTGIGTVGRTRLFSESCLGSYPFVVPDSHVTVVRTHNEIKSEFVFFYISSSISQQYIEDNLAGSTNQKELYIGVLDDMSFPLPPLAEQNRIVAKIEELFAQLDLIEVSI